MAGGAASMIQPPGSSSLSRSLETAQATVKKLKAQIDNLERENRDLKRTVYDLNFEQARLIASLRQPLPPFDVGQALSSAAETERDRQASDPPDPFSTKPCRLVCRSTLKGHGGAVYDIAWSPSGSVLASASFDGACRLWDVEASRLVRPHEPVVLRDAQRNVSCLAWISAGALVAGSYDGSAVVWDTRTRTVALAVTNVPGSAILSVSSATPTTFFAATSQGAILGYDTRAGPSPCCTLANGAMVSTIACLPDGKQIISGDKNGQVRTWALATGQYAADAVVGAGGGGAPVSHVAVNGDLLAVNSFDNVLRLYDRPSMALAYELVGHRNRNWPIRSSIFVDHDQTEDSAEDEQAGGGGHAINRFLIASGSADSGVFLFDIGAARHPAQTRLSGKHLDGHRDRVYSVAFHHDKLVLASCSADGTVKIWK